MKEELKYNRVELERFARQNNIMLVILYGSRASGEADDNSDWDIAVMFQHGKRPDDWLHIFTGLEELFRQEVDLAEVSARSDPLFRWEVFRNGIALFEDEAGRFNREYFSAQKVYWDTAKFRKMAWEMIEEKYK
jgi:predicted nucleotidyltransferase